MHVLHRFTVNFSHGIGSRCSECALKWQNPGKGQQYTAVEHGFEEKRTLATETATVENIAKKKHVLVPEPTAPHKAQEPSRN